MKNNVSDKERSILLFKHFIGFLEIWGQENYGEDIEIDWFKVYNFTSKYDLLDLREDLEDIVFEENEEIFRDKVYKWIEDQALNGYPIWRLFKLNKWLNDKLEKEFNDEIVKENKKLFNKYKCLKCKYYNDDVHFIGNDKYSHSFITEKHLYNHSRLLHMINCNKRKQLLDEKIKHSHIEANIEFSYKKFNLDNGWRFGKWTLDITKHNRCPYFEKDDDMTYEKFIDLYGEFIC